MLCISSISDMECLNSGTTPSSISFTAGEINMNAAREVHPLKSIGCFIKKPITAEQLLTRIRAELE